MKAKIAATYLDQIVRTRGQAMEALEAFIEGRGALSEALEILDLVDVYETELARIEEYAW